LFKAGADGIVRMGEGLYEHGRGSCFQVVSIYTPMHPGGSKVFGVFVWVGGKDIDE
jgi:hypothetical protein